MTKTEFANEWGVDVADVFFCHICDELSYYTTDGDVGCECA